MSIIYSDSKYRLYHYSIFPISSIIHYWRSIVGTRFFRDRMFDTPNPTIHDALHMMYISTNQCYFLVDIETGSIVADAMLNNARGLCAQVHFSIHPRCFGKTAITLACSGIRDLFNLTVPQTGESLSTLIGITPTDNRSAICFLRKINFKKLDILSKMYYTEKENKFIDCQLSILKKEDFYNGREGQ